MEHPSLIIGYQTEVRTDVANRFEPTFEPSPRLVNADAIQRDIERQRAKFLATLPRMPYFTTLTRIYVVDLEAEDAHDFRSDDQNLACAKFAELIRERYAHVWPDTFRTESPSKPIIGFDIGDFLKLCGLECSLPDVDSPLPLSMWVGNHFHRDVRELICPDAYKIDLAVALSCRGLTEIVPPDFQPHQDAKLDTQLAATVMSQLCRTPVSI